MLSFLPSPILLIINSLLIAINVIVIATPMMILGIIKFLLPFHFVTWIVEKTNYYLYKNWVFNNRCIIALTNKIHWHITGDSIPTTKKSCIVICNHISWLDILFIGCVYKGNIPTTKFFMKHSLIYIPFAELVDVDKEIERLKKEESRLEGEIKRCNGMLNNEKFTSKAPQSKIDEEKGKLVKYTQMLEQVKERLEALSK